MTGSQIIITIAVILFARLGVRLYRKYRQLKREAEEENQGQPSDKGGDDSDSLPSGS